MSEPTTKELREWVNKYLYPYDINYINSSYGTHLMEIADAIDAEHRRRMADSRRESRQAAIRYLRGVLLDYERGIKRVRKGDAVEVVRCRDCMYARRMDDRFVCTVRPTMAHLVDADEYCSRGKRAEADDG